MPSWPNGEEQADEAATACDVAEPPSYLAYEFTGEDGRTLLYVETFC